VIFLANIRIVTDSTVDLPNEQIEKLNIHVVPLTITIDGQSYLDRTEITPTEFIEKMKQSSELPKSSQPSIGRFQEVYDQLADEGYEVISIHLSGKLSGTVRTAEQAAQLSKANVTVVDSFFISLALSFQVCEAAKMAQLGYSKEEIIQRITEIKENTSLYVVVSTLENLVKGGRIGRGRALIGSLLNIKPIACLEDGEYFPVTQVRSQSQIIRFLLNEMLKKVAGKAIKGVGIAQADAVDLAMKLKEKIVEHTGFENVQIVDTTPVISAHTGTGAIGFMFYTE
jgi:DegV family protein with EDD domain